MPTESTTSPRSPRRGLARVFFGAGPPAEGGGPSAGLGPELSGGSVRDAARRLVAQGRPALVLMKEAEAHVEARDAAPAWAALAREMALIPGGPVPIVRGDGMAVLMEVPAFYLDRLAVTNRQFARFVAAGCYDLLEIWPREVWPSLLRFVDRTGVPGPATWERGRFPAGKADHPVVGVCWYEALAYARWVGKRLPTAAEWQTAGGWPEPLGGGSCNRFPWGDLFDPARANLWASGLNDTVSVTAYPSGDTPNGLRQMTGNVWEWLDDPLDAIPCRPGESLEPWKPMRRIAGGAFNTYLAAEATCHFVTGQAELDRRNNLGFRCAVSADRIRNPS
jgi:iron(II)-dependent oxidoreductase